MVKRGADGWLECACGKRHWGLLGAAGLYLWREAPGQEAEADPGSAGSVERTGAAGGALPHEYLGQLRAPGTHLGRMWGLPGGARDYGESAVSAALREAAEETGLAPDAVRVWGWRRLTHPGPAHQTWSYTTVVAELSRAQAVDSIGAQDWESEVVEFVRPGQEDGLVLPQLAEVAGELAAMTVRPLVIVDAANVVGSRPDGWWKDRAGAAARLLEDCARALSNGFSAQELSLPGAHWYPDILVVLEGKARPAGFPGEVTSPYGANLRVELAAGEGDDAIAAHAANEAATPGRHVVVLTADKALSARCRAAGALVAPPRTLIRQARAVH
ncbi:NUDIX domain-containing protein [Buchananella felis]|uniref:NUDIX domain-containing protein n=1 Tax=Buchananella felis TaxID=3231492 RepID=UPI003526F365